MSRRRKFQELTIRDNFMFAAVMMRDDNCKKFLEMLLGIKIQKLEVSYEKSIIFNPECKGVRLDIFADVGLLRVERLHKHLQICLCPDTPKADLNTSPTMARLLSLKES